MTAPEPNYAHRARLARVDELPVRAASAVHDGDTYWLVLDLGAYSGGIKLTAIVDVRLKGIDTYELREPGGPEARDAAAALLMGAQRITVATEKPAPRAGVLGATLGRTVATVYVDGQDLADLLRASGHAKPPATILGAHPA